jgi:hypothetical protein
MQMPSSAVYFEHGLPVFLPWSQRAWRDPLYEVAQRIAYDWQCGPGGKALGQLKLAVEHL